MPGIKIQIEKTRVKRAIFTVF